jgi:CheY-like chemotaxis protein
MESILNNLGRDDSMTVVVVDQRPDDYAGLVSDARGAGISFQFVSNGNEALRLARTQPVDLWMVNNHLLDMSGLDVCALLKSRLAKPVIYMVADEYDQEIEREARIRGAVIFGCKPLQPELISQLTVQNRKPVNGRRTLSPQAMARPPT